MIRVDFHSVETKAGRAIPTKQGTITLDDNNEIVFSPATSSLMRGVSLDPITVFDDDDEEVDYDPKKDPKGWINNLYKQYKSYVLYATKPVEGK